MAKKRRAPKTPTIVERFFLPAIQSAEKILAEAGLPDVNRYVRFHDAESRFTDDLNAIIDLQPGQTATAGHDLARRVFGPGSEQEWAAKIIGEYRGLCTTIRLGEHELATYLAARLGILLTEYELEPAVTARPRSLQAATLTRQHRKREAEQWAQARAAELRESNPKLSDVRLAVIIRREMEKQGDFVDFLPKERTIRGYLKHK